MPELFTGQTYDLKVEQINEDASQFPSGADRSKIMHAHMFLLSDDEGNEYKTQICDTHTTQQYADTGDWISVTVNKLSLDLYSVKYLKTIKKAEKKNFNPSIPNNPVIGGTAAAIAMQLSVEHYRYAEGDRADIFGFADEIFNWFHKKL